MAKDTDKDGVVDVNDPWPNDPTKPARNDTVGITDAGAQTGIDFTGYIPESNPFTVDAETAREMRGQYRGDVARTAQVDKELKLRQIAGANWDAQNVPPPGGGTRRGGRSTVTQKQIRQYNEQQVRAAALSVYQTALGREISAAEAKKITAALNKELKKNPTVTKTTSTSSSVKSVTKGGLDEQQWLMDQAKQDPEYAPYQQATTYFNAMLNSLNGTVGRGI